MKSWFLLALLLILNTTFAMATSPYVGTWNLADIIDAESNSKELPEGKTFQAKIEEGEENQLRMFIKIGNNLRTKINLGEGTDESREIKMGGVLSTMMMPEASLFAVEKFLSKTFPTVTKMELDGDKLTFVGEGSIVLSK
mmetsp:Transcript_30257/g.72587  ORF Transcript_30257/g.72587 Transcript_30257/m.72587 type:complete len:140 (-) Transcript_30257:50-469(-)|eukprot:CAMPEP_0113628032 /NCGR_PEP_ID=MMETSP0017_2-20120614/14523_1 /TAXON_ID=2856 /ORGANISM="Cylindrotheca closterium" /LENGTH=139 /DNA_ID=CAMNT_0000538319 /DNA_START=84 /DNA_END=503 /DNA_ORIENTATION=+ /assembly_acc=CAM_ASM_000147